MVLYQSRNKSIGTKKENLFVRKMIKIFYMAGDEKQASPLVHKIIRHTVTAINSINVSTFSGVRCPAASSFDGDTRNSTCVFVYIEGYSLLIPILRDCGLLIFLVRFYVCVTALVPYTAQHH